MVNATIDDSTQGTNSTQGFATHLCPGNQAVIRFTGNAGARIDRLFVSCGSVGADGLVSDGPQDFVSDQPIGFSPGGQPFNLTCPDRKMRSM